MRKDRNPKRAWKFGKDLRVELELDLFFVAALQQAASMFR